MMRKVLLSTPLKLTASFSLLIFRRPSGNNRRRLFSDETVSWSSPPGTRLSELPRVDSLVDGCDYKHWLVVMHPPENYPLREEIIQQYIATLATALGSEKAAKESIYSVSTKYYYAFSCKLTDKVTHRIRSLPRVKWVLPDSYLCPQETGYGGEPYIAGNIVPYEEKYHAEWLQSDCSEDHMERTCSRKPRRKRRRSRNSHETSD
ncbi:UNVERIFIED_CONTAM: Multiple organellar RNA editing factor 7, mitochondrial [Sesamum radiatum]|uniref:Multiple organellar RNA editing factor 7, mitochondrial n=1 Tax=Sesamum radiatum TaxID=300843 RepID=A0AAW2WIW4_SESRA